MVNAEQRWFALQVRSRFENVTAGWLSSQGFRTFLPKYKSRRNWSDRVKELELPLFPGYLFCRFDAQHKLPVLRAPGVMNVVSMGSTPAPLDDGELDAIQTALGSGNRVEPWPFMKPGDRVVIQAGALRGIEGVLIETKGKYRLVLSVGLLQRSVAVEIDSVSVAPCSNRTYRPALAWAGGITG